MTNKNTLIFATVCLLLTMLSSCKGDVASAGESSLTSSDSVIVCSDTLHNIHSANMMAMPSYATPDSFLLGECRTNDYGTISATLLTQLAAPEGWVYPDSSVLDSVCLYIYYTSWYGDGNSPLTIEAHAIDREPLCYDSTYASNVSINRFCSMTDQVNILKDNKTITPQSPTDSIQSSTTKSSIYYVRARLNDTYAQKLFQIRDYSSQAAFNKQFPGIVVSTTFGSSAALYVSTACISIHYHYTFPEGDHFRTMNDTKTLYSNTEVKQIGQYEYTDQEGIWEKLNQDTTINYVLSPCNIYCKLSIPTEGIREYISNRIGNRRAYINLAQLRLDVLNGNSTATKEDNWAKPAKNMMLLNEEYYHKVFVEGAHPSDTSAVFGTLTSEYDTLTTKYNYYYSFDLSFAFTQMLHQKSYNTDTIKMLLIPVDLGYTSTSSTSYISSVRMQQSVSATKILSSRNPLIPMDIEVVYSGFSDQIIDRK